VKTYTLIPQRASTRGWQPCPDHQAERWAVFEVTAFSHRGHPARKQRMLMHSRTKAHAEAERAAMECAAKPLNKPGLGQRFRSQGRKIIAQSLSYDQYHRRNG
jgi:hypothetical protein